MIQGLFLEGAGWDRGNLCLVEAEPMQMVSSMPAIHFRPVERKKTNKSESVRLSVSSRLSSSATSRLLLSSVHRHVRVSLLLLPGAFGRSGPGLLRGQRGAEVWSRESGPLDQERDGPAHEPGPLRNHDWFNWLSARLSPSCCC